MSGVDEGVSLQILIAEDNAINCKLAESLLNKKGLKSTSVHDGEAAVEAWRSGNYDLILMDVQMPGTDGMEATRRIREEEQSRGGHIPIIAMTAHAMKGDREKCLAGGMDDYVSKPMKAEELYAAVERCRVARTADIGGERADNKGSTVKDKNNKPAIDLSRALESVDGDRNLLGELVEMFVEDISHQLKELEREIASEDMAKLEMSAHSLKGAVGNFGADAAYELAYELEEIGRQGQTEGAREVFNRLRSELERVNNFLITNQLGKGELKA